MRLGASFSPRRCGWHGIPARETFAALLELGFGVIRLSAYWDEIGDRGYTDLDWLLDAARSAGKPVLLTVGMKAMQWPEFHLPAGISADPDRRGRVGRDATLAAEVLAFVSTTVARYRDREAVVAWQVENEPFNRSGPNRWWIDPGLVRREIAAVRALDSRPIAVNAFAHFDAQVDADSRPRLGIFGARTLNPEEQILDVLGARDVLGLDVYTAIGRESGGATVVLRAAPDWPDVAARIRGAAERRDKECWIIEAQAEPWEPTRGGYVDPISFGPADIGRVHGELARAGFTTVLLWGCEYWFWRAAAGDRRWLDAATQLLGR